jgi:hypothetical protein
MLEDADEDDLVQIVEHLAKTCRDDFKKPTQKRFEAEMQRLHGHQQAAATIAKEVAAHLEPSLSPRDDESPGRSPRMRRRKGRGERAAEAPGRGRAAQAPRRGRAGGGR